MTRLTVLVHKDCGHRAPMLAIKPSLFEGAFDVVEEQRNGHCWPCSLKVSDELYDRFAAVQDWISQRGWSDFWNEMSAEGISETLYRLAFTDRGLQLIRLEGLQEEMRKEPADYTPLFVEFLGVLKTVMLEIGDPMVWGSLTNIRSHVGRWRFLWKAAERNEMPLFWDTLTAWEALGGGPQGMIGFKLRARENQLERELKAASAQVRQVGLNVEEMR